MFIFPVQLTTSRIGNLTRLIHTLLYVMTIHTYIQQYRQQYLIIVSITAEFYSYTYTTYCTSIIIIIISAHKSDLSYPWSQTQASLSIHRYIQKTQTKEEKERKKNNRRENLPRSDRRGREKIKQEQKNKSKDPPRISERQIDKQARQTKCQDHTNCRYRTRVAKHTPPVAGRGAADSQALRQGAPV